MTRESLNTLCKQCNEYHMLATRIDTVKAVLALCSNREKHDDRLSRIIFEGNPCGRYKLGYKIDLELASVIKPKLEEILARLEADFAAL